MFRKCSDTCDKLLRATTIGGKQVRAIMVDDEPLLLAYQEQLIKDSKTFELIGTYNDPTEAYQAILTLKPDVVFLDIEMYDMNGIEMADKILAELPMIKVVFITAYSDYAVQAFEVNAIDYLLKPLNKDRLLKTYERLKNAQMQETPKVKAAKIHTLPQLQFIDKEGNELNLKWRTTKARELFLFLLLYRNRPVHKEMILEILWPEYDVEKSYTQLYTAIYQIRNAMKSIGFQVQISSKQEYYVLNFTDLTLDVDVWEVGLQKFSIITNENKNKIEKLLRMYKGDFLASSSFTWIEMERERLRRLWIEWINRLGNYYEQNDELEEAIKVYETLQKISPFVEQSYFSLMKLYRKIGDGPSIDKQYEQLCKMTKDQFDTEPTVEIIDWYKSGVDKESN